MKNSIQDEMQHKQHQYWFNVTFYTQLYYNKQTFIQQYKYTHNNEIKDSLKLVNVEFNQYLYYIYIQRYNKDANQQHDNLDFDSHEQMNQCDY